MRRYAIAIMAVLVVAALVVPMQLGNSYLRADEFDQVTVRASDTVTAVAGRYTTDAERLEELTAAIIEVNGLKADGTNLRAGQTIMVPVLGREHSAQLAER